MPSPAIVPPTAEQQLNARLIDWHRIDCKAHNYMLKRKTAGPPLEAVVFRSTFNLDPPYQTIEDHVCVRGKTFWKGVWTDNDFRSIDNNLWCICGYPTNRTIRGLSMREHQRECDMYQNVKLASALKIADEHEGVADS